MATTEYEEERPSRQEQLAALGFATKKAITGSEELPIRVLALFIVIVGGVYWQGPHGGVAILVATVLLALSWGDDEMDLLMWCVFAFLVGFIGRDGGRPVTDYSIHRQYVGNGLWHYRMIPRQPATMGVSPPQEQP